MVGGTLAGCSASKSRWPPEPAPFRRARRRRHRRGTRHRPRVCAPARGTRRERRRQRSRWIDGRRRCCTRDRRRSWSTRSAAGGWCRARHGTTSRRSTSRCRFAAAAERTASSEWTSWSTTPASCGGPACPPPTCEARLSASTSGKPAHRMMPALLTRMSMRPNALDRARRRARRARRRSTTSFVSAHRRTTGGARSRSTTSDAGPASAPVAADRSAEVVDDDARAACRRASARRRGRCRVPRR